MFLTSFLNHVSVLTDLPCALPGSLGFCGEISLAVFLPDFGSRVVEAVDLAALATVLAAALALPRALKN